MVYGQVDEEKTVFSSFRSKKIKNVAKKILKEFRVNIKLSKNEFHL